MVNWSEHTKRTLPSNCSNTTQDKTKARKERRRVLIMGKTRRREGAQGAQFSRLDKNKIFLGLSSQKKFFIASLVDPKLLNICRYFNAYKSYNHV